MTSLTAVSSGFGLGILYFGGLWGIVRTRPLRPMSLTHEALGRLVRMSMAGIVFYALLKSGGIVALLGGLVGVLLARWFLIRQMGKSTHGR